MSSIRAIEGLKAEIFRRGVVLEEDVRRLRDCLFADGRVVREEAELLFSLNDRTDPIANDAAWVEFFVEAVLAHLLEDDRSPGLVDPTEMTWLLERMEVNRPYDENERSILGHINHVIHHEEVFGGIHGGDLEAETPGIRARLFCRGCEGGKGGDLYYFSVSAGDAITRIALADVMGHGPAVTDISQWLYDSLASRINRAEGHEVLADLNRLADERGFYAITTATVVTFYRIDSRLAFASAGHPPGYVYRQSVGQWVPIELTDHPGLSNVPLGVTLDATFHEESMPLACGDRLFLYTDGLLEAANDAGELFGSRRLLDTLNARSSEDVKLIKDAVLAALWQHTSGDLSHDDVTFMAIELI